MSQAPRIKEVERHAGASNTRGLYRLVEAWPARYHHADLMPRPRRASR